MHIDTSRDDHRSRRTSHRIMQCANIAAHQERHIKLFRWRQLHLVALQNQLARKRGLSARLRNQAPIEDPIIATDRRRTCRPHAVAGGNVLSSPRWRSTERELAKRESTQHQQLHVHFPENDHSMPTKMGVYFLMGNFAAKSAAWLMVAVLLQ